MDNPIAKDIREIYTIITPDQKKAIENIANGDYNLSQLITFDKISITDIKKIREDIMNIRSKIKLLDSKTREIRLQETVLDELEKAVKVLRILATVNISIENKLPKKYTASLVSELNSTYAEIYGDVKTGWMRYSLNNLKAGEIRLHKR